MGMYWQSGQPYTHQKLKTIGLMISYRKLERQQIEQHLPVCTWHHTVRHLLLRTQHQCHQQQEVCSLARWPLSSVVRWLKVLLTKQAAYRQQCQQQHTHQQVYTARWLVLQAMTTASTLWTVVRRHIHQVACRALG